MDVFPLNLVLAVAVASATIFLGFLPTRNIRSPFFAQEAIKAALAWVFVAMVSPAAIMHYHFIIAILCFGAWWQFRRDKALSGKMWLSIASGLGISIGVMLILAVTPRAYPPGLPEQSRAFLLASIYLGGAVIGLAYVSYVLIQGSATRSGIANELVQRYVGLLLVLVLVRAASFIGPCLIALVTYKGGLENVSEEYLFFNQRFLINHFVEFKGVVALLGLVLPYLAFMAWRSTNSGNQHRASLALAGVGLVGLMTEIFIRFHMG